MILIPVSHKVNIKFFKNLQKSIRNARIAIATVRQATIPVQTISDRNAMCRRGTKRGLNYFFISYL